MNHLLAQQVIEECIRHGIEEFCVAPGSRNAPLIYALSLSNQIKIYYWSEERSAAFFALGRIKATGKPVAVVTTSGTAAAELLPAAMSAHYLGLALLMLTADRPSRFRKTGAPQAAEQVNLFGCYTHFEIDVQESEEINLKNWSCQGPAHINICFEEPKEADCRKVVIQKNIPVARFEQAKIIFSPQLKLFCDFIQQVKNPFVVIGSLPLSCQEAAIQFLLKLKAPIYAEGTSNLREHESLKDLRIHLIDQSWHKSSQNDYPIDGVLRLGEIPTARLWRDLEEQGGKTKVCSISDLPFTGLSWGTILHAPLKEFFVQALDLFEAKEYRAQKWLEADRLFHQKLLKLFAEEPQAEPSLFYQLSSRLPLGANVYLGNSLPIREWDLAAIYENKGYKVYASRGVNGIDGQISTFLGVCQPNEENWAILGDLTVLYDMVGPWILSQLPHISINLIVINNGGGQIFSRLYSMAEFINPHALKFEHLAAFWNMEYERWEQIPEKLTKAIKPRLIEILPETASTQRFWRKMADWQNPK